MQFASKSHCIISSQMIRKMTGLHLIRYQTKFKYHITNLYCIDISGVIWNPNTISSLYLVRAWSVDPSSSFLLFHYCKQGKRCGVVWKCTHKYFNMLELTVSRILGFLYSYAVVLKLLIITYSTVVLFNFYFGKN